MCCRGAQHQTHTSEHGQHQTGGRAAQEQAQQQYDSDDEDEMQEKEARWKEFLLDIAEDKVRPTPTPNQGWA